MPTLANVSLVADGSTYTLNLEIKVEGQTLVVEWTLTPSPSRPVPVQEGRVVFDFAKQADIYFSIHIPPNAGPLGLCLAGCVGKSLIEPVIECLAKSRDLKGILKCLKGKGLSIGANALACALECLAKHPA